VTVDLMDRIQALQQRLQTYSPWEIAVEVAVIWVVVFLIVRFVQGTRAAGALKGLLLLLVVITILSRMLGGGGSFQRLGLLYDKFIALVAIAMIVIFQPELRRALVRLGETSFLRSTPKDIRVIVEEVSEAAAYLSKAKFGALIVLERQTKLAGIVEGGTKLGAELSGRLLQSIFFPGSALHDLAVVIKGRVIDSAGVQLPLAEPADMPDRRLGSRHRAAVGLSQECDALVVVVSEETGSIRLAERGKLSRPLTESELHDELTARLTNAKRTAVVMQTTKPVVPVLEPTAQERRDSADPLMESLLQGDQSPGGSIAGQSSNDLTALGDTALGGSTINGASMSDTPIGAISSATPPTPDPRTRPPRARDAD
jgi:diadenylate cyclase